MRRRDLLALGAATALSPLVAHSQTSVTPRVGVLMLGRPDPSGFLRGFRGSLRAHGYVEGQNIVLELRNAEGSLQTLKTLARELAALKVDVIVGFQTPSVVAAKEATTEIPIVMCPAADPIRTGLVTNFARPDGNITGVTTATAEVAGKNLELIREFLPAVRRVGVIGNPLDPFHKPFVEYVASAAPPLGLEVKVALPRSADELEATFAQFAKDGVEAAIAQPSLPRDLAAAAALKNRLPLFAPSLEFAEAGALLVYSADTEAVYRQAATFVDKILKGRKPADLPVELSTKFLLIVNLKTANALGITLPQALLLRADQVIE